MRVRCLPVVLLALLTLAGCMRPHRYAAGYYAAPQQASYSSYYRRYDNGWHQPQPPQVLQYRAPPARPAARAYVPQRPQSAVYAARRSQIAFYATERSPNRFDDAEPPYRLDSGDRLRIVVFGQQNLSSTYIVDAGGQVAMPLIGAVPARGLTPQQLAHEIAERLRHGYVRDPHVSVEVAQYRPFFILGEVNNPGQYPYVAHMTVETAVAIAGGYSPRADKGKVAISRDMQGHTYNFKAPPNFQISPGDTIRVKERWF